MNFRRAFRVDEFTRMALVGAGGKTTTLFQLAATCKPPVVVTASTHLGAWQTGFADRHLVVTRPEDVERFAGQIEGVTLFTGQAVEGAPGERQRLAGLSRESLDAVHGLAGRLGFSVLVEADGSRQRPLKAPAEHEPVIPGWARQVIVVAGMLGLGQPLAEANVHRVERFAALSGLGQGEMITSQALARVLLHPLGGMKGIPTGARKVVLLNQVSTLAADLATDPVWSLAEDLAAGYDAVVIGSTAERKVLGMIEPVAGIVLAAGGSRRFGESKLLANWKGKPLLWHAVQAGLRAGLDPLIVVTGAESEAVRLALEGLPVTLVHNADWEQGQSTSVRAGVRAVSERAGAAVFLLGDMPLVSSEVIKKLVERHHLTLMPVVAPRVSGRRANPVLFDHDTYTALLDLRGDTGGRAVMEQYPVEYVDWEDDRLLLDVDTPEDYRRLMEME